jgi:hypothetical protein
MIALDDLVDVPVRQSRDLAGRGQGGVGEQVETAKGGHG